MSAWGDISFPLTAGVLQGILNATRTLVMRTAIRAGLWDGGYRYLIHPAETALGLTDANLTFGFDLFDVRRYGAKGDGATDDQAAIQTAVNLAASLVGASATYTYGSVHVYLPAGFVFVIGSAVTLKSGVWLVSDGVAYLNAKASFTAGVMLDTPVVNAGNTPIYNVGVKGVYLHGNGAQTTQLIGLRIINCQNPNIENFRADNLSGPGFQSLSKFDGAGFTGAAVCQGIYARDCRIFNCVLQPAANLATRTGSYDIQGSDHEFVNCETLSPLAIGLTSANQRRVGWNLLSVNESRWVTCKGSLHDIGWYVDPNCTYLWFKDIRADVNFAGGIESHGVHVSWEDVDCNSNGQAATNTYDQIVFGAGSSDNILHSGILHCSFNATLANNQVTDNGTVQTVPNRVGPGVWMQDAAGAGINDGGGFLAVTLPDNAPLSVGNGVTVPVLQQGNQPVKRWQTANAAATNITNFTGAYNWQTLELYFGDSNTTIVYNAANIRTLSGANIVGTAGQVFRAVKNPAGYWQQT